MASIFTRIIQGEIPAHTIYEDDQFIAFLDVSPLVPGHTLVVPKQEVDYIFDLDDDTLAGLMLVAKKIAPAIKKACPCLRLGVTVIGLEVPHTHVHLVPMQSMRDMNFANPKLQLPSEEMAAIAERIKANLE